MRSGTSSASLSPSRISGTRREPGSHEPIFFYIQGTRLPEEMVINSVGKNKITGYLSIPRPTSSRQRRRQLVRKSSLRKGLSDKACKPPSPRWQAEGRVIPCLDFEWLAFHDKVDVEGATSSRAGILAVLRGV